MFGEKIKQNRLLTAKERSEDLQDSLIWDRYPRTRLYETHYYKNMIPEPVVNFALNFKF